ncbi:MAG: type VI secretion protein IcmF/TssM N-terminal domain-containing protein [Myxococcota bacterium]
MGFLPENRQARVGVWLGLALLIGILIAGFGFGYWLVPIIVSLLVMLGLLVFFLLRNLISEESEERLDRGYADGQRAPSAPGPASDLATRFRRAVAELKASRLGRDGLHALPWLLVVGAPGSGKSQMIGASSLELPAEFAHVARGTATPDCDWWFTNEAILLDTAGRYLDSDASPDRSEWRDLLKLMRKARPGRPINGLVVTISAVRLLTASAAELEQDARNLRRRMNEITDLLRVDAPIYVVVTQLDRVEGFNEVVSGLPPNRLVECLGFTNPERRFADAGDLAERAFEGIRDRIESLVGELLMRETDSHRRRRVLGLPHELEAACDALTGLLRAAFAPSVYEETPFLRGVYFTSAQQGGGTSSAVLSRLEGEWARAQHAAAQNQGWFLRDLFRDVVIGDQTLAIPHSSLGPRGRRALLATGAALCAAAVAVWSVSAYRIFDRQSELVDRARRVNDAPSSLEAIDRLRRSIGGSDEVTVLGRAGLGPTLDRSVEDARKVFLWAFGTYFEEDAKSRLRSEVKKLDPSAFEALAELALDLNWMMTRTEAGTEQRPGLVRYARRIGRNETDKLAFTESYDDFVRWLPESEIEDRLENERRTLSTASSTVLSIQYLERWSSENAETRPPVRYADLGLPRPRESVRDAVSSAYTKASWEGVVRGLVSGVEETKGASEASVRKFLRSYVVAYDAAWERFLLNAPVEPKRSKQIKDSPYHALLARVRDEMSADLPRAGDPPAFVAMLQEVLRTEPLAPPDDEEEAAEEEAPPWSRYQLALEEVAKDVEIAESSGEDALKTALEVAGGDDSSFHRALDVVREIVPTGDAKVRRKLREILEMPILNGLKTVLVAATAELDREWRVAVAGPFGGRLSESQLAELYDESSGALRTFQDTWLAPFFRSGVSKPVLRDLKMPFGPAFLSWLEAAGKVQQTLRGEDREIRVRLVGVPSRVVAGGVIESKRLLQVDCSDRLLSLEFRPSRSHTIPWTSSCTEVKLRVSVLESGQERELPVRTWRGPMALPNFFRSAERNGPNFVWKVEDADRGIEIAVPYRLRSGSAILDISHRAPPDSIRS